jgi:hypothetical protein
MILEIKSFLAYIFKSKLVLLGLIVYFLFNLSALTTHFMDFFFFGSSVHHCCQGLDFYQIPNGAYAFTKGGDLTGNLPPGITQYSQNYVTNFNVYHPLITIVLGGFFILFNPDLSIDLWIIIKIFITFGAIYYIYKNFKGNEYLSLGIFIFLINFSQYNDIKISQYQFLFNIFTLLLLINIVKNKNKLEGGTLYFLTLVAKPVSLLWAPILFIKREWTLLFSGLFIFFLSTLTFKILGIGDYYINNVINHVLHPIDAKGIDFMSLDALLRNSLNLSVENVKIIKYIFLFFIYLLAFDKKISIVKLAYLLAIYFLFFYDLVFQYHFSILGPILSICLLVLPEFQTRIAKILILIINLPTTFFIFRILGNGIINNLTLGVDPTIETWRLVSFFQILPIVILAIIVLIPDFKSYLKLIHKNAKL